MLTIILLISSILALNTPKSFAVPLFFPQCPLSCTCDYTTSNELNIICGNNAQSPIELPIANQAPLTSTVALIIKNSNLSTYPVNLCTFASTLRSLDLSSNRITTALPSNYLSCLTRLEYVYLYNNRIPSVSGGAFQGNPNLLTIDLSRNEITDVPNNLFTSQLTRLLTINLRTNLLTRLDSWFFFLPAINDIDLSDNLITQFTNDAGFSLSSQTSASQFLNRTTIIDLRINQLTAFDDSVLRIFGVCDQTRLRTFLQIIYPMRIDANPIQCNCPNSFNLLTFVQPLINSGELNVTRNIFLGRCTTGSSVFLFDQPSQNTPTCSGGVPFSASDCTVVNQGENQVAAPNIPLALRERPELFSSQIAGIVLGLLGFLILFLILLYCICPIEILSLIFTCIPFFYSICPCKSGVRRDKEYDLFISYNRSNSSWVKNKLVPFIHERCLVENFILHYNSENREQEVFGPYIRDIMNRSSCILFVLSDAFLMKEWNNREFQLHLRYLITKEKTRFVCVQLHDVIDEEVDEYFVDKLQIPRFVSLENDEFLFWTKLAYHLYTNDSEERVMPVSKYYYEKKPEYSAKPNDDLDFDSYIINRPIIHLPSHHDPESRNRSPTDHKKRGRRMLETFRTTFMGPKAKEKRLMHSQYVNAGRSLSSSNSRRPSKVDTNLDEKWRFVDEEYGVTNVMYSGEKETPLWVPKKGTRRDIDNDGYSIKKSGNNLEITMPVAHDVYMSHQVQNKKMVRTLKTSSGVYQEDSNESSV